MHNFHEDSEFDIDLETGEKKVRKKRCKKHPEEFYRYICRDHEEMLCPKCLIGHKICDFEAMGA